MANRQQIQQCITNCTNAANMLRTAANAVPTAGAREMMSFGATHIEMCIRKCEHASMQAQQ